MTSKKSGIHWNENVKQHNKVRIDNGKSVSYALSLSNASTETGVKTITKNKRGSL